MQGAAQAPALWIRSLYWLAMACGGLATLFCWRIVYETNRDKSSESRESYLGWRWGKIQRIFNDYEQKFPKGRLIFWFKISFISAGWSLGLWVFLVFWYFNLR
jgi:hypothetical protein